MVAGDFNAKVALWGSATKDTKGDILSDFEASHDLQVGNRGNTPTYQAGGRASVIDYTLARLTEGRRLVDWVVDLGVFTGLDHNAIRFTIQDAGASGPRGTAPCLEDWAVKKLNEEKLVEYIRRTKTGRGEDWLSTDADDAAERFHQYVRAGCCLSMPRRGTANGHRPAYWWNEDIAQKRRTCIARRRAYQRRGRRSQQKDEERLEYNETKRDLRIAIRKSQEKA